MTSVGTSLCVIIDYIYAVFHVLQYDNTIQYKGLTGSSKPRLASLVCQTRAKQKWIKMESKEENKQDAWVANSSTLILELCMCIEDARLSFPMPRKLHTSACRALLCGYYWTGIQMVRIHTRKLHISVLQQSYK